MAEILTEEEIQVMTDSEWGTCVPIATFLRITSSHRALQERVKELEAKDIAEARWPKGHDPRVIHENG